MISIGGGSSDYSSLVLHYDNNMSPGVSMQGSLMVNQPEAFLG